MLALGLLSWPGPGCACPALVLLTWHDVACAFRRFFFGAVSCLSESLSIGSPLGTRLKAHTETHTHTRTHTTCVGSCTLCTLQSRATKCLVLSASSRPTIAPACLCKNRSTADMQPWLQAFLLAAMKFHCYVKELPLRAQADSQLAWLVIQRGIEYLSNLVKTRVQGACRRCQLPTCFCMFSSTSYATVTVLCCKVIVCTKTMAGLLPGMLWVRAGP